MNPTQSYLDQIIAMYAPYLSGGTKRDIVQVPVQGPSGFMPVGGPSGGAAGGMAEVGAGLGEWIWGDDATTPTLDDVPQDMPPTDAMPGSSLAPMTSPLPRRPMQGPPMAPLMQPNFGQGGGEGGIPQSAEGQASRPSPIPPGPGPGVAPSTAPGQSPMGGSGGAGILMQPGIGLPGMRDPFMLSDLEPRLRALLGLNGFA